MRELQEKYIRSFIREVIEKNIKKMIAYHGSPNKFSSFDYEKRGKSGQVGSDTGFWFTTNKKVAVNFANVYPEEMYDKIEKVRKDIGKIFDKKRSDLFKKIDLQNFIEFLMANGYETGAENLKIAIENKDQKHIEELVTNVMYFYGRRHLPEKIADDFQPYFDVRGEYEKETNLEKEKITNWYDENYKGYLYTVEINVGRMAEENGEDIGTNEGRRGTIATYENKGYDSVFIKFADTGQGLADEIVVFDAKNIKILKVEEI